MKLKKMAMMAACFLNFLIGTQFVEGDVVTLVEDIYPGAIGSELDYLYVHNGELFLWAYFPGAGFEPGKYGGIGVKMIKDINPGISGSLTVAGSFVSYNDKLYFPAYSPGKGTELWCYERGYAYMVADIAPGVACSNPEYLTVYNGKLYFQATKNGDVELWSYDGVKAQLAADIEPAGVSAPSNLTVYGDALYFVAYTDKFGRELMKYKKGHVSLVTDLYPGANCAFAEPELDNLKVHNGRLYFTADSPDEGLELRWYDGVDVGVYDSIPGPDFSYPITSLTTYNRELYYWKTDWATTDQHLMRFDGLREEWVDGVIGSDPHNPRPMVVYDNRLFFTGYASAAIGTELWTYDRDSDRAWMVIDLDSGGCNDISSMVVYDEALYFTARSEATGKELWKLKPQWKK